MKHKKIFQSAANEKLIEMMPSDTEEILVGKLITSYLYEYYRNNKINYEKLRKYLEKIDDQYSEYSINDFSNEIEAKETYEETFFGSFLSDDSDSEEEKSYNTEKNIDAHEFGQKAGRSSMYYVNKTKRSEIGDLKISEKDPSSLFNKSTRHLVDRKTEDMPQIKEDLKKLNKLYSKYQRKEITFDQFLIEEKQLKTKFYIAQYRGITYLTTRWSQQQRKAHRRTNENELPIFSHAAYKRANLPLNALHDTENQAVNIQKLTKAANEIKEAVLLTRKKEVYKYGNRSYDSLADLLQTIYTTNYDGFHQLLRSELLKGLFPEGANPFVSTGDRPYHALKYAYGIKPYEGHEKERLRPRWQKNGRAERPYSGKIYVSLHPITDYDTGGPTHVPSLNTSGRIVVDNLIVAEYESTFPGLISENRTIATHVAKYPSFKDEKYNPIYEYKYGINIVLYRQFRKLLQENPPHTPGNKSVKKLLGEWLCAFHEVRLIDVARNAAEMNGGILIYRDIHGNFSLDLTEATHFHSSTPEEKRNIANDARRSRATGEYSPGISAVSPEAFSMLTKSMKKLFIENKKEMDSLKKLWPSKFFQDDDLMITLPDGNCAFNGVALFLYEKLTQNLANIDTWHHHTIKNLGLALKKASYDECEKYLSLTNKNPKEAQKLLSPILRKMTVEYMKKFKDFYEALYLERLFFILEAYLNQEEDIVDADSFLVHFFIKRKLENLCNENEPLNIVKSKLELWWKTQGFLEYLEAIQKPAKASGDFARWGGATELDILGKIFDFRLGIKYTQQRLEFIGRLPSCPFNISNETKIILEKNGYKSMLPDAEGQYHLNLDDLNKLVAYRNIPENLAAVLQILIAQIQLHSEYITYHELILDLDLSPTESKACLDFLVARGIAKTNGFLWVKNNHQLDVERITSCLQYNISDQDWASLSLTLQYNKTLPICLLKHDQNHWSYENTSVNARKNPDSAATCIQRFFREYTVRSDHKKNIHVAQGLNNAI